MNIADFLQQIRDTEIERGERPTVAILSQEDYASLVSELAARHIIVGPRARLFGVEIHPHR